MNRKIQLILIAIAWILGIILFGITYKNTTWNDNNEKIKNVSESWTVYINEKSQGVINLPVMLDNVNSNDKVVIRNKFITTADNQYIMIRGSYQNFNVKIDDREVYSKHADDDGIMKSFGCYWHLIPFNRNDSGKNIEIEITSPYDNCAGIINEVVMGERTELLQELFRTYGIRLFIAVATFIFSLLCLILYVTINVISRKKSGLLYLFFLSLQIGIWILCESRLWQFIFDNQLQYVLSYVSLYMMPVNVVYYIIKSYKVKHQNLLIYCAYMHVIFAIVVFTLQLLGIVDLKETLIGFHITALITIIVATIITIMEQKKNREINEILISFMIFGIIGVIDIILMYVYPYGDQTHLFQMGILFFLLFQLYIFFRRLMKLNQTEGSNRILRQLAFSDELTGLQNRTAYQKRIEGIEKNFKNVENLYVIMLDINNLKNANDLFGHSEGDKLIKKSGEFIQSSFKKSDSMYRIGGDEFVIIESNIDGNDIEEFKFSLELLLNNYNATSPTVPLEIAMGIVKMDKRIDKSVLDVLKRSDRAMYIDKENKKRRK